MLGYFDGIIILPLFPEVTCSWCCVCEWLSLTKMAFQFRGL